MRRVPNLYRPTPKVNGTRRHVMHRVLADEGVRYVVLDHRGDIHSKASVPITRMPEGGIAASTVPRYGRGFLTVLDNVALLATSTAPGAYDIWVPPADAIEVFKDCIRRLGGTLEESTVEPGVYHVTVEDEDNHDCVVAAICGTFHMFDAAVKSGAYAWPNPFEVPFEQRKPRMLNGIGGTFTILPRFRFRMPRGEGSPLRTDPSDRVLAIVPALIAIGAPIAIIMMIRLMIQGLARIAEQIRINLWDWWNASQFGNTIDTTSKRSRGRRVKQQVVTDELLAELLRYGNHERVALDANGWTLDDWRRHLSNPAIPMRERRKDAKKAALFPSARKTFYSKSGVIDVWYRPAMLAAGLPTRTHYIRHSGVNDFLTYVDARDDLTPDEKDAAKLEFGKAMGWKWPIMMLERYSLPARKAAQVLASTQWLVARRQHQEAIETGLGKPAPAPKPTTQDRQLSRLVRHSLSPELLAA
jgi:hypothetical protein